MLRKKLKEQGANRLTEIDNLVELTVINNATGEVLTDSAVGFRTRGEVKKWEKEKEYREKHRITTRSEGEKFVNSHMERIKELRRTLDDTMLGYVLLLLPSLKYDGTLGTSKRGYDKVKDFESVFRVKSLQAKKVVKALLDAEVLYKNEEGVFCMNKAYHWKGSMTKTTAKHNVKVMTEGVKLLQESGVKAKDLGVLYALLPFINYNTNLITHNPYESDIDKMERMDLIDVAEVIGYENEQRVSSKLRSVTFTADDGRPMYVFAIVQVGTDKRSKHIRINPMLVRRVAESEADVLVNTATMIDFLISRPKA